MANNRELSQFGSYIVVNDSSIIGINTDLAVTGIITGRTLSAGGKITLNSSGIVTATSGVVTYYGDGQHLINTGVRGIATSGGTVGTGVTFIYLLGAGISTATVDSGIATVYIQQFETLDSVTKRGNSTSDYISLGNVSAGILTANYFVKTAGTSAEFLKADGSVDSNVYLTAETDTLNVVTTRGNNTSNGISVGILTATSFVKSGGTSSQFLKADGSIDSNTYVTDPSVGISDDTSTNGTRYLTFISVTSGSITAANVSSTKLTFNPSTGNLSSTQFTSLSDATKKTNIRPIENPIEITKQLDGVRFDWIENNQPSLGLIAQEVEKVIPELVETNSDGIKTLNYSSMVGLLIEAIKEQQVRIEELERKLNAQ